MQIDNFFDILKNILTKKSDCKLHEQVNFNKIFSSYMLCRYISMDVKLMKYAEILNGVQDTLSKEQFYKLAYNIIPKQKNSYIKYISKKKTKDTNED